jgi:hypothetical protein
MNQQKVCVGDSRKHLTTLESFFTVSRMARYEDVVRGLAAQVKAGATELQNINDEMLKLRPAYQRYRELAEQVKAKDERTRLAAGVFLNCSNRSVDIDNDLFDEEQVHVEELCDRAGITNPRSAAYTLPLWKVARELVRQVPELQVVELENFLKLLGYKTSRQAVESAIETHRDTFRIKRRGREKFVSLKGE